MYLESIRQDTSNTNAVGLWALGCIFFRLATGAAPFPPGLALKAFCQTPDRNFPFKNLLLSEDVDRFIREFAGSEPGRETDC
jgi:hypothetical protein